MPKLLAPCRVLTVEIAAVAGLAALAEPLRVGDVRHGRAWLAKASTTDLFTVCTWWAAVAIAAWVVVTTVTYTAGRAVPALRGLRVFDAMALPVVRRAVDGALALSLTAGAVSGAVAPASAAPATSGPPVVHVSPDGKVVIAPAGPTTTTTATTAATLPREVRPPSEPAPPPAARPRSRPVDRARTHPAPSPRPQPAPRPPAELHVVVAGDNLWRIAASRLAAALGRAPSDAEIVPYWQRVVEANRATLRSGDPNLIHPGEIVALPPLV
jgi:hypothetical protein